MITKLNVVVGSNEGDEFIRQAKDFTNSVKSFGFPCENMILEQSNHFSMVEFFPQIKDTYVRNI